MINQLLKGPFTLKSKYIKINKLMHEKLCEANKFEDEMPN